MHRYCYENQFLAKSASDAIESGDLQKLANAIDEHQLLFDQTAAMVCMKQKDIFASNL